MFSRGVTAGVLAALTALVPSSCGSNDDHSVPKPSPGAVTTVTLSKSTPSIVEGKDYAVLFRVPTLLDGAPAIYLARADRRLVMSVAAPGPGAHTGAESDSGSALATLEEGGKTPKFLAQHGTVKAPRYIVSAVAAGHKIVWVETTQSNMESMPWQMYSYDLDSGVEKHIASHEWFKIADPPWPSDRAIQPQVVGNWVYFIAVDHLDAVKGIRGRSAYRVPIDGGKDPELIVPNAAQIYADGSQLQAEVNGKLVGWDPTRGKDGRDTRPALPGTCGTFVNQGVRVTCSGTSKKLRVDSPRYGNFTIDVGGKDTGYFNATNRWVSFSTSAHAYVLDLKRGRLMGLRGAQSTSTSPFSGNRLEYAKLDNGSHPPLPQIAFLPR